MTCFGSADPLRTLQEWASRDRWFATHHAEKMTQEILTAWVEEYGQPEDYAAIEDEQHEYWVRLSFFIRGWLARSVNSLGANSMIAEALAKGEDATGLCTVRDWAEAMMESPVSAYHNGEEFIPLEGARLDEPTNYPAWSEMSFTHKGKRYNVEMVVTGVRGVEDEESVGLSIVSEANNGHD